MPGFIPALIRVPGGSGARVRRDLPAALVLAALAALTLALASGGDRTLTPPGSKDASTAYGKLPLSFMPNEGQTDARVRYYAQGPGYSFFFTKHKAVIALTKGERGHALELRFLGANRKARLEARSRGGGTVNYFHGKERHTGLPTYREVVYRDLWPGIDMTFRGKGGKLEYEFLVRSWADPNEIRLSYAGADRVSLTRTGDLVIDTPLGAMRDRGPRSLQRIGGKAVPVESSFKVGNGTRYAFTVGTYDHRRSLLIDPGLGYSTYLGGSGSDFGADIAVDSQGAAYVLGDTDSLDYPTTTGAYSVNSNGDSDSYVTKLNASGSTLVYSTYFGGANFEGPNHIAVDAQGNAYVSGWTLSSDFPTTPGAFRTHFDRSEMFVTKLNPAGSSLVYSTYLGGTDDEEQRSDAIAVDDQGNAYVTGSTFSTDFPTTPGAYDTSFNGGILDAFVTKLNASGSGLVYSTYLGGSGRAEEAEDIAVDAVGNAYAIGTTDSADFPTTAGAYDTTLGGGLNDTYLTKLNATGSGLGYSTYLGGTNFDDASEIAVDDQGGAFVVGTTGSTDFPTTPGAYDTSLGGFSDAFVTKLNAAGSSLSFSTYLGGSSPLPGGGAGDRGLSIALDDIGNAHIAGEAFSADFPTTADAFDRTPGGASNGTPDAFMTKLDDTGSALIYSTLLGGGNDDSGNGIAVDARRNAYVIGFTQSSDFSTTPGAFDTTYNSGFGDAFATKFNVGVAPGPPATLTLSPKTATNTVDSEHCLTATVTDASGTPTPDIAVVFSVTGTNRAGGTRITDSGGQATFCYTGELLGEDQVTAFADFDPEDGAREPGEPGDTATKEWMIPAGELCRGSASNNGRILASNGDRASFRGEASASGSSVRGRERYEDRGPAEALTVSSSELQAITCSADGSRASIFGRASIDGLGSYAFRIDVFDGGPGRRGDSYRILLQTGYDSGVQTLRAGDVRVRLR